MKPDIAINNLTNKRKNESGMTLIEILVASVVGMILMTGVFQFFIIQVASFNENRMTSEMQQELRYAVNYVSDRLKLAGNGVPPTSGFDVIENIDGGGDLPDDVLVIGSYKSLVISTDQKMGNHGSQVKVEDSAGVELGDLIVISYPPEGWQEIFIVTKLKDNHIWHDASPPWNDDNKLDHAYPLGSVLSVVSQYSFFVEVDENGRSNLMVQTQASDPQILAGDIDNFQIRFKLKDNTWVDEPFELSDVRMVEITLRAMTPEPLNGYEDPVYGDAYKRIELKSIVVPRNIALVTY